MSTTVGKRKEELDELKTVQFVTGALFEVSAENIGKLRSAFEKNKLFYIEISDLYRAVKTTALSRGDIEEKGTQKTRGVSVVFTTNTRFYGSVNTDVMRTFIEHMRVTERDCVVIGRTGRAFIESYPEFSKRCTFFAFENDQPTTKEMRQFLKKMEPYDQVFVFHPSFVNIFSQNVAVLDITHTPRLDEETEENAVDYIFEPELPKILRFFETRVRYLLFQRAMLEAELARTSARLLAMSKAEDKAEEEVQHVQRLIRRETENFNNMRLLESFAAISKWRE